MSQLDGIFDWTCTYLQDSELTEVHGVTKKRMRSSSHSQKSDKFNVYLPGPNISHIMQKKKRYFDK